MSPTDKETLIKSLQSLSSKPLVGMCGDGSNDCRALKAADVGISLSDAEASLAAPFTSRINCVQSVNDVLREGRAALVNSFQTFKFIATYSIIQFVSVVILYWHGLNLTDSQYMWIDLVTVLPLSVVTSWTSSSTHLTSRLPQRSLMSPSVLVSLFGQASIQISFLLLSLFVLSFQSCYTPIIVADSTNYSSLENTTVFLISNLQYSVVCVAFANATPWRKHFTTNIPFLFFTIAIQYLAFWFLLCNPTSNNPANVLLSPLQSWLQLVHLPFRLRMWLLTIMIFNTCTSVAFEWIVVSQLTAKDEVTALPSHRIYNYPVHRSTDHMHVVCCRSQPHDASW